MSWQEITPKQRILITVAVMAATLMQVLDTTIVNVALPHMQGSLSATPDQITWVLTSYLIASAILMPITGYLTDRLGRRRFFLWAIGGFILTSVLCGAATSLNQIVVFRFLQGAIGASLVPLSQSTLADIYPPHERGKAMAIWGVGVMVGPILGPTLGGYITEITTWRWNFYINIPVGIFAMLFVWQTLPETLVKERHMDWLGLLYLSIGIGALQYFVDQGNRQDWFDSNIIRFTALASLLGFTAFILHSLRQSQNVVFDIKIFKDRNFAVSSVLLGLFGIGLFGALVIMPLMLENLFNYPVLTTGLVMAPRGIFGMLGMIVVSKIIQKYDPRFIILAGSLLNIAGTFAGTNYSLMTDQWWFIWPLALQGFGIGMIFVTLSDVAFTTLPESMRTEAAGLFSLLRTIGSSVGISIVITVMTRHAQMSWNHLTGFIHADNPNLQSYLNSASMHFTPSQTMALIAREISLQSQMVAFTNVYHFIAWSFIVMIPLIFLIKYKKIVGKPQSVIIAE